MTDVTGMRVDVEVTMAADPEAVWDLLADVTRVGEWSPECVHAAWLDVATELRPGVRFRGRNRSGSGFEWTVTGEVVEVDRPRTFAWVVLGRWELADRPSSTWRYDLEPLPDGGTRVRQSFVHGPDVSGVTRMIAESPGYAETIIENRRAQLRSHMIETLAGVAASLS